MNDLLYYVGFIVFISFSLAALITPIAIFHDLNKKYGKGEPDERID